ncbi:NUDIX hydrolase, partial [Xanthovirga aplysinae]|uniref:NUDIX hydrolase n=1 Tax=Xanthovirga aplysinae TaxID=2529853 RepID=UPI0012BD8162
SGPIKTQEKSSADLIIDNGEKLKKLKGNILVINTTNQQMVDFLQLLEKGKGNKLKSITFISNEVEEAREFFKNQFTIIKAGGGLVVKDGKYLMIFRLKKWDLPKGKLEKGESEPAGALREVEEECNVSVSNEYEICNTWHTYIRNHKRILKKTVWYKMSCLDDTQMAPQLEEDIEAVRWMDLAEVKEALKNTYPSIKRVFKKFDQREKEIQELSIHN